MEETKPHVYIDGRTSAYTIPDMIDRGQDLMQAQVRPGHNADEGDGDGDGQTSLVRGVDSDIDAGDMSVDSAI